METRRTFPVIARLRERTACRAALFFLAGANSFIQPPGSPPEKDGVTITGTKVSRHHDKSLFFIYGHIPKQKIELCMEGICVKFFCFFSWQRRS
jgi:hypothetical protein